MLSPTLNFEVGQIATYPIVINEQEVNSVKGIVAQLISDSKTDWDAYEASWDFERHPLLRDSHISG